MTDPVITVRISPNEPLPCLCGTVAFEGGADMVVQAWWSK